MLINENIKNLRLAAGLSQKELATLAGIRQPTLAQIERGTKTPSMPLGWDIAAALGCSIETLYSGMDKNTAPPGEGGGKENQP